MHVLVFAEVVLRLIRSDTYIALILRLPTQAVPARVGASLTRHIVKCSLRTNCIHACVSICCSGGADPRALQSVLGVSGWTLCSSGRQAVSVLST